MNGMNRSAGALLTRRSMAGFALLAAVATVVVLAATHRATAENPPQLAAVTHVAVMPLLRADGSMPNTFVIYERAGDRVMITQYDAATNKYYTGTDSATTGVTTPMTPELDYLLCAIAVPGDLNGLRFFNAAHNLNGVPTIQSGAAPELTTYAQQNAPQQARRAPGGPGTTPQTDPPSFLEILTRPPFDPRPTSSSEVYFPPANWPNQPLPTYLLPPNTAGGPVIHIPGFGGTINQPTDPVVTANPRFPITTIITSDGRRIPIGGEVKIGDIADGKFPTVIVRIAFPF